MSSEALAEEKPDIPAHFKNKGDLTKGEVKNHLIRLSLPMMWGIGAIISFQLADMYFIGLLGTEALAAVTFTFPVTFVIFSFIMGFGISMSSVVSRLIGEGNQEMQQRVTSQGLLLVLLISFVLAIVGLLTQSFLFEVMGAEETLMPIIIEYMTIWYAGAVFITMPLVGNAAIRASGDTFLPAIIMTVVAVVNVILDPLLIFGLWGFPEMGVQGAAVATVFANAAAMCAGLYVLYLRKKLICFKQLVRFEYFWDSTKRLLFIALPAGLTNSIQPIVNALIISLLAKTGVEAVAAYGIVSRIEAFAFIIIMGVAVGMAPIIGQNYGAARMDRVNETLRLAIRFAVIYSVFVAIILVIFGRPLAALFQDEPRVIDYAVLFFMIVPGSYAFSNLVNGWTSAFNAMGMPHYSFAMIVIKMICLMIPAIYIGYTYFDVTGLFAAIACVNIIAGLGVHFWCRSVCIKKTNQLQKP